MLDVVHLRVCGGTLYVRSRPVDRVRTDRVWDCYVAFAGEGSELLGREAHAAGCAAITAIHSKNRLKCAVFRAKRAESLAGCNQQQRLALRAAASQK